MKWRKMEKNISADKLDKNEEKVDNILSQGAQEELDKLKQDLGLDDISSKIISSTPRPTFLALETKNSSTGRVANMFSSMEFQAKRELLKKLYSIIKEEPARKVIKMEYENNEKLYKRFLKERF